MVPILQLAVCVLLLLLLALGQTPRVLYAAF